MSSAAILLTKPPLKIAAHQVEKVLRETNYEARGACRLHRGDVYAGRCGVRCVNDEARVVLNQLDGANLLDRGLGGSLFRVRSTHDSLVLVRLLVCLDTIELRAVALG